MKSNRKLNMDVIVTYQHEDNWKNELCEKWKKYIYSCVMNLLVFLVTKCKFKIQSYEYINYCNWLTRMLAAGRPSIHHRRRHRVHQGARAADPVPGVSEAAAPVRRVRRRATAGGGRSRGRRTDVYPAAPPATGAAGGGVLSSEPPLPRGVVRRRRRRRRQDTGPGSRRRRRRQRAPGGGGREQVVPGGHRGACAGRGRHDQDPVPATARAADQDHRRAGGHADVHPAHQHYHHRADRPILLQRQGTSLIYILVCVRARARACGELLMREDWICFVLPRHRSSARQGTRRRRSPAPSTRSSASSTSTTSCDLL